MNWRFNERGWVKQIEFTAVAAIAMAVACVLIGQTAERYAAGATQAVAQADAKSQSSASGKSAPVFNAIDYATTGSLKGQTVVLSPCETQPH
ncbi:MAG TPA: hypothetical protein VGH40_07040 [Roseiarcus sp.]|jgi:UDP-N-acetylmuramoylalanine-D-glutamate ligase